MAREYARDPEPEKPGHWLRMCVRASFAEVDPNKSLTLGLGQGDLVSFLAALAVNPELLGLIQAAYDRWHRLLMSDGVDEVTATAVRFAADGIYFAEGFGLAPPVGRQRQQVCDLIPCLDCSARPRRCGTDRYVTIRAQEGERFPMRQCHSRGTAAGWAVSGGAGSRGWVSASGPKTRHRPQRRRRRL